MEPDLFGVFRHSDASPQRPGRSYALALTPSPSPFPPQSLLSRPPQRFVMNKVEKTWLLTQLMAYGAPVQQLKTVGATCTSVADSARFRHILDSAIVAEQQQFGMSWRRTYMHRISAENVRYVANTVSNMAKKVLIASATGSPEHDGPVAATRSVENHAQHGLDQVVLDYKEEATKRMMTTDEDATRALTRNREGRVEK